MVGVPQTSINCRLFRHKDAASVCFAVESQAGNRVRTVLSDTATATSTHTGQHTPTRGRQHEAQHPFTPQQRSAAHRLRTTMAAVKLAFTWLGVRKTLAPEQPTTTARAFHADRALLAASKLIVDTKNPAYRAVAAVRAEESSYWRTVTLPFPEADIRLVRLNSLDIFAITRQTYRERLQEAARDFELIQVSVGELLVGRSRRNILRRSSGGAA